jgi:hypothetical protein
MQIGLKDSSFVYALSFSIGMDSSGLMLKIPHISLEGCMEEWLDSWRSEVSVREVEALPCFFVYFIWWTRNLSIFQEKYIPPKVVAGLVHKLVIEFRKELEKVKRHITKMLDLIEGTPWGFFDGESQGNPPQCGVGVVLYISADHHFEVRYTLGQDQI